MHSRILSAAAAGMLLSAVSTVPAGAQIIVGGPSVSGNYAVTYSETCQAYTSPVNPGSLTVETLAMNFNGGTKTVKVTGSKVSGVLVVPKMFVGGNFIRSPVSKSWKYSNTATTVTINGVKFDAVFGPVIQQIPQSFVLGGITGDGCAVSATGILQNPS